MILVIGGTTEGRSVAKVLDAAAKLWYYSTKGTTQEIDLAHGIRLTGAMDTDAMTDFCREKEIGLIIDAAHPFAVLLHQTVAEVSTRLDIPVARYERKFPARDERLIWCRDYLEAIQQLEIHSVRKLLALTGVNTIAPLRPFWEKHDCWFRILDRDDSRAIVTQQQFLPEKILYYHQADKATAIESEKEIISLLAPDAILTKESGYTGHFGSKAEAARQMNIPLFVIKRPTMPESFYTVYGEAGLRRQVDRLLPGFFSLRTGFTTGTCATAAVKSALTALLTGNQQKECEINLPSGEAITLPVADTIITHEYATCTVIKDAGDDPDATNKCKIVATISFSSSKQGDVTTFPSVILPLDGQKKLLLCGGNGVGKVTLPGLGLEVDGPAINSTPRKMIEQEVREVLNTYASTALDLTVILSVPRGEEIARRTFNSKLGIVGGISIIGTSGIVRPFSHEAFIASIRKEAEVAKAVGCQHIIISSGAKSERHLKALFPDLLPQAFIHYGNYIGETLRIASELQFSKVTLGIMIGKAVKLAEGNLDTHSRNVVMNKAFLADLATEAGYTPQDIASILSITLARQLWEIFADKDKRFFTHLTQKCLSVTHPLFPNGSLNIYLLDEDGQMAKLNFRGEA